MKVYIIITVISGHDGDTYGDIAGVYSSKGKAQRAINRINKINKKHDNPQEKLYQEYGISVDFNMVVMLCWEVK